MNGIFEDRPPGSAQTQRIRGLTPTPSATWTSAASVSACVDGSSSASQPTEPHGVRSSATSSTESPSASTPTVTATVGNRVRRSCCKRCVTSSTNPTSSFCPRPPERLMWPRYASTFKAARSGFSSGVTSLMAHSYVEPEPLIASTPNHFENHRAARGVQVACDDARGSSSELARRPPVIDERSTISIQLSVTAMPYAGPWYCFRSRPRPGGRRTTVGTATSTLSPGGMRGAMASRNAARMLALCASRVATP